MTIKTYTEDEINSLIDDLQKELPAILQNEVLAKNQIDAGKEGGNGTAPVKGKMSKADEDAAPEASVAPEGSPEGAPAESAPEGAPSDAPAGDEAPEGEQGAQDGLESGDEQTLEQAYGSLADEELQAHYEALKAVLMSRMSGGAPQAGQPPVAPQPSAGPSAPPGAEMAPPSAPPMGAPAGVGPSAPGAGPDMGPPQQPLSAAQPDPQLLALKSEVSLKSEELAKQEGKLQNLEKQLEGVTNLLELMLKKPNQKAVTSMAEFVAKSELDKPAQVTLSKSEINLKLGTAAKRSDLTKSDRELINKYYLTGGVNLKDIQHLLN